MIIRHLLLLCLWAVAYVHVKGQTIIQLTFTAEVNGNHQPLDSILVQNITQGGDTVLYGTDTLLVLDHGIGIEDRRVHHSCPMILYPAYPNPVTHTSTIRLRMLQDGPVSLRLFDLPGRELATFSRSLAAGEHSFTFYTGKETFYLLVAEAHGQRMMQKLISLSQAEGRSRLSYDGYDQDPFRLRKGKPSFPWMPGDDLRFIGYAMVGVDTVDDAPIQSGTYLFQYVAFPPGTVHCDPSNPTAVVAITSPITGIVWMDRDMGASQVATSSTDTNAYGDLYQWGRFSDGHQCRTSATTTTLSSSDVPGHANFILGPNSPYDWRSPQNTNLWLGVNGVNNPCPNGYRLPTNAEMTAERQSWSSQNAAGAFASPLKLSVAGYRNGSNGSLYGIGSYGYYWTSTDYGTSSFVLGFNSTNAYSDYYGRAHGRSVRCVRDN